MEKRDVRLKHKVQLRRKVEESKPFVETTSSPAPAPTPEAETSKSNSRRGLVSSGIVVGVLVLCFISYFVFFNSSSEQPAPTEIEVDEEVVAIGSDNNTDAQSEGVQDEANSEESPEAIQIEQAVEESKPEANAPVTNVSAQQTQSNTAEVTSITNDVEAEAMKVIRGDYGIGRERKAKLGSKYQPIQNRVNELKREGVF